MKCNQNTPKTNSEKFNRSIISHININSLRNKFKMLKKCIKDNAGILLISETKLDESFPMVNFKLKVSSHRTEKPEIKRRRYSALC